MNVYFVNRYSKLKGPFDIIDSNRQHIIKVGDICLRDTIDGIAFYVVHNLNNTWNACKLVGVGENNFLSDTGNTLLFSFDGLSRRKGDIALIKQITLCFREKVIDDFFRNAVDILNYKKDFWDVALFPQFFASSQELVDRDKQKKSDERTSTNHYPSIFAQYLSKELLELLIEKLKEGNELKEAYQILRMKDPEMFRKALMQFLTENPSGTIFDKPFDAFTPTMTVTEVEISKSTPQNDRLLQIVKRKTDRPLETNVSLEKFFIEIGREPLLSVDEEVELAKKIRKGDIDARNKLVRANMRFVVELAKQYLHKGLEFEDFLQEGLLGLIKAADHFDTTRGFGFYKYAPWWIRRYLSNAIATDSLLIRVPSNVQKLHKKVKDFKEKFEQKNGFMPSITDIEIDGEDNLERISFLDSLPSDLRETCIPCENFDVFEDTHNDILDYENNESHKLYVNSLLAHLSKRERNFLIRIFGIGVKEETLEHIGDTSGLTRERVRQIKEKTIKKLREIIESSNDKENDAPKDEKPINIKLIIEEIERRKRLQSILKKAGGKTNNIPTSKERRIESVSKRYEEIERRERLQSMLKKTSYKTNNTPTSKERRQKSASKHKAGKGLSAGDRILYNSMPCVVLEKTTKYNITRLKIMYDDGRVDDVPGDLKKVEVLNRQDDDSKQELSTPAPQKEIVEQVDIPSYNKKIQSKKTSREELFIYYKQLIMKLNQAIVHGVKNPAKPALLVAVIDAIDSKEIRQNNIIITTSLENKYNKTFAKYTGKTQYDRLTSIAMPFWHLQSDKLWFLEPQYSDKKGYSPSKKWIVENVKYARLDDDLWYLLQDGAWRNKLRNFIIENKLMGKSAAQNKNEQIENNGKHPGSQEKKKPQFLLSTSLSYLVGFGIITKKQLKQCHKKKLWTIGDVKKKIEYYHLTPNSTRFTKYTLNMWFAIIGLLNNNV